MGRKTTYTPAEVQKILGISIKAVYNLIREEKFMTVRISGKYYILKQSFDEWVESQPFAEQGRNEQNEAGRTARTQAEETTLERRCYTVREVMDQLGISRPSVYDLIRRNEFRSVVVAGKFLVSRKSFDEWLDKGISTPVENKVL